ncbi:hypothetical protein QBC35DRAFT_125190 [Podospora australis]|uniref:Uncharacterized protein n=1 Tax=Podospora australis TaxID=1536484 RepID=A0AAN6WKX0_9PEZI|nr:hypothetical protein QBC35DRAFT_125190 [Podospora australis]
MDCWSFGWLSHPVKSRTGPPTPSRASRTHYHRHRDSSDQTRLLSHQQYHHRNNMKLDNGVDQFTLQGSNRDEIGKGKLYQIRLSSRDLEWSDLQEYLQLEFENFKLPKQQKEPPRGSACIRNSERTIRVDATKEAYGSTTSRHQHVERQRLCEGVLRRPEGGEGGQATQAGPRIATELFWCLYFWDSGSDWIFPHGVGCLHFIEAHFLEVWIPFYLKFRFLDFLAFGLPPQDKPGLGV